MKESEPGGISSDILDWGLIEEQDLLSRRTNLCYQFEILCKHCNRKSDLKFEFPQNPDYLKCETIQAGPGLDSLVARAIGGLPVNFSGDNPSSNSNYTSFMLTWLGQGYKPVYLMKPGNKWYCRSENIEALGDTPQHAVAQVIARQYLEKINGK